MEHKYYINKLYICNFKPFVYGENQKEPYVTIDFSNESETIYSMILAGPNGYGKTSIFQAIYFALTGNIDTGNYVDGRKKVQEHVIINDLSKCCFVVVEFKDTLGQYIALARYAEQGIPGVIKKAEEAADFKAYIIEGKFNYREFNPINYEEKRREDIAKRFGEKNILEWVGRNYIQQEHEGDLILKPDKERVNFLNLFISKESDGYFAAANSQKERLKEQIEKLEGEIRVLAQKAHLEIEGMQGEEPKCKKVYLEIDYMWDKETYTQTEPFQEYENHARRVLKVVNQLPYYVHKRKIELLDEMKKNDSVFSDYILNLYDTTKRSAYKQSFYKKQYLQKLMEEGAELWKEKLNEEYLTADMIAKIQCIRQKRQEYFNALNDKQFLYKKIEELRKHIEGKEEVVENIFGKQCPLCGWRFDENQISLAQAIRQTESIFQETRKILDNVLEEKEQSWRDELGEVKKQIEHWIKKEIGEEDVYIEIQNAEGKLEVVSAFEKKLDELHKLIGGEDFTVFLDKEKFAQSYKEISEYEKAVVALKTLIELVHKSVEDAAIQQEYNNFELDMVAYSENEELIVSLSRINSRTEQLREKIYYLEWKKKEKMALEFSSNKAEYETKVEEIRKLYEKEIKLSKVLSCQETARKEYLNDIMKYLEIPLYIYSGKLIQTHQSGLGIFCFTGLKEDALTEFKMSTDKKNINQKLDVSNKFSAGQKNVTNIALMLALKKIAATKLDIFMIDDPCQSLDELNIASFVEIIKNEFTSTQIIMSTHEDKIAGYVKYKNDKAGKKMIMFNVQEKLYNIYA